MELLGTTEIAALAGVSRSAVGNWVARDPSFPRPVADLACGQIWEKKPVEDWLKDRGYAGSAQAELKDLQIGAIYTHDFICKRFGGDAKSGTYLPQSKQTILCGCFTDRMNPKAPDSVLVGNVAKVITKAERLEAQGGTIPIFMKRAVNQWEYCGEYEFLRFSKDPRDFEDQAVTVDRGDVVGALFFRRIG